MTPGYPPKHRGHSSLPVTKYAGFYRSLGLALDQSQHLPSFVGQESVTVLEIIVAFLNQATFRTVEAMLHVEVCTAPIASSWQSDRLSVVA